MTQHEVKRGEIWWADLGQAVGSEQGGLRPIVIIQNDMGNKHAPTVIGAPVTSRTKRRLPTHVNVSKNVGGLSYDSTVLLEQIRAIDKSRLCSRIGYIDMDGITKAAAVSIDIPMPISKGSSNYAFKHKNKI